MDINEIMDTAKAKNGISSDNKLAKAIGTSQPTIFRFRQGFGYPSEENMMKLGELAGIDRASALLLLNMWKAEGEAKNTYRDILSRLSTAAALCFIMAIVATPANAKVYSPIMFHYVKDTVYYGK